MLIIISTALIACNNEKTSEDTGERLIVAENIVYDVVIKVPDTDDPWEIKKLEGYMGERMVSEIFNSVYEGKVSVYEYHTGERLSAEQVREKELQQGYDRNNLGKIQFTENWYYNTLNMEIEKVVKTIVLGYENRTIDGKLIGYSAAFRLDLE